MKSDKTLKLNPGYIALIPEGQSEHTYLNILLDDDRLIFSRDDLLRQEVLHRENFSGSVFTRNHLRLNYPQKLNVIIVCDSKKTFKIKPPYNEKLHTPVYVLTRPEIEMLQIIHFDLWKEFQKRSNVKPSTFLAERLRIKVSQIKNYKHITRIFTGETLEAAIREYARLAPKPPHNCYHLAALLK